MSFWLTLETAHLNIVNCSLDQHGYRSNSLTTSISQYADNDISKTVMKTVDDAFRKKLSYNANEYIDEILSDQKRQLWLFGEWKPENQSLALRLEGEILKDLCQVIGNDLEVRVILSAMQIYLNRDWFATGRLDTITGTTTTKAMKISISSSRGLGNFAFGVCEDDVKLPIPIPQMYLRYTKLVASARIRVEVSISNSTIFPSVDVSGMPPSRMNKEILEEGVHADLMITASNGKEIKAHRCFLSVQSPVFRAMFRNKCKESLTLKIEIPEMREEAVKALLAYVYYEDLSEAEKSSEIAFELFEAGHKYEVKSLEDCAKQLLLKKPKEWMDVGVALRVFTFAGKMEGCEELKDVSIQVMKLNFKELKQTEEYKELFRKDPASAMELCAEAFSL